jgi:hypothetical protein
VLATRTLKVAEVVVSRIRLDVTKPHLNAAIRALGKSNSAIAKLHQKCKHLVGQLLWQVICRAKRLADLSPNGAVVESCVPGNIRARPELVGCPFPAFLRRIVQHRPRAHALEKGNTHPTILFQELVNSEPLNRVSEMID